MLGITATNWASYVQVGPQYFLVVWFGFMPMYLFEPSSGMWITSAVLVTLHASSEQAKAI
ncbi:hypothetical protein CXF86_19360 [Shewanella sp. GutCb]|nr:hypothetical protein CXF86_19360 [Shewanella sp. GutCb]